MSMLDDPTLALITRFVVDDIDNLSMSEERFLRHQVIEIKSLIENQPVEHHQQIIFDWIKSHAENYRHEWHQKSLRRILIKKRCSDCPLVHQDEMTNCVIHQRWSVLLKHYLGGKLATKTYVEESLQLLKQYKDELKVSRVCARS